MEEALAKIQTDIDKIPKICRSSTECTYEWELRGNFRRNSGWLQCPTRWTGSTDKIHRSSQSERGCVFKYTLTILMQLLNS